MWKSNESLGLQMFLSTFASLLRSVRGVDHSWERRSTGKGKCTGIHALTGSKERDSIALASVMVFGEHLNYWFTGNLTEFPVCKAAPVTEQIRSTLSSNY